MSIIDRARKLRAVIEENAQGMDSGKAADYPELFPEWDSNAKAYKTGELVRYKGVLMQVLQPHTSQRGWEPDNAPSLFAKVLADPTGTTVQPWEQPDSTNPYKLGDKVTHNGYTWVSVIDNNVWEPGVYGWNIAT